jgi:hypothetical protein
MSAEKKPGDPAEIPPFLQPKQSAKSGGAKPDQSAPPAKIEQAAEIPFFLRSNAPAEPERAPPVATPPPRPAPPKTDPGVLRAHTMARPVAPEPVNAPPPKPVTPAREASSEMPLFLRTPAPAPAPAAPKPPPVAAAPPPAPVAPDLGLPSLLSAEEVQRKLEAVNSQVEAAVWTPPVTKPVPEKPKRPDDEMASGPIDWESAPAIFDQMVTGIRRDRRSQERDVIDQNTKIEADWQHVLNSMRELQRKVANHRNLIYFTISRDNNEISIKVVDHGAKRGYSIYTLARHHPAGAHPTLNAVWLIEFPARERHYYDAKAAMAELVTRIAGSLA